MTMIDSALVYQSPKLGDFSYRTGDLIRFPQGILGFEQLRDFLLMTREECEPFVFLAAIEQPEVALPLIPMAPATLGVKASRMALVPLGETGDATIVYYAVASMGPDSAEIIVNPRAPIVIDFETRLGCQVILPNETLPIAAPLA